MGYTFLYQVLIALVFVEVFRFVFVMMRFMGLLTLLFGLVVNKGKSGDALRENNEFYSVDP